MVTRGYEEKKAMVCPVSHIKNYPYVYVYMYIYILEKNSVY